MFIHNMKNEISKEILDIVIKNPIHKSEIKKGDFLMINNNLRKQSKKYKDKILFDYLYLFFQNTNLIPGQQEKLYKKLNIYKNKFEKYTVLDFYFDKRMNSYYVRINRGMISKFHNIGFFEFHYENKRLLTEKIS